MGAVLTPPAATGNGPASGARAAPGVAGPAVAGTFGAALRSLRDSVAWNDRHRVLVRQPLFARCTRDQIRRLLSWGEFLEVRADEVLTREGSLACWLFVVVDGELVETRRGREVGRVRAGDHVGAEAVLGFAPQPVTLRTAERSVVFCLGRRYVLSVADVPEVRAALLPDAASEPPRVTLARLMADGGAAWQAEASHWPSGQPSRAGEALLVRQSGARPPARSAFQRLAAEAFRPVDGGPSTAPVADRRRAWPAVAVAAVLAVGATVAGALLYHPPIAVVVAGEPFDVADDIVVEGVVVSPLHGRYLATPVRFVRPNVLGVAIAKLRGKTTTPARAMARDQQVAVARRGDEEFHASRQLALRAAADALGLDPANLPFTVTFRSRQLLGGSAGLAYALALVDLLDPADLATGRTVAATGVLDDGGAVLPVWWAHVKAEGARSQDAHVFLLPAPQAAGVGGAAVTIVAVDSVHAAIGALRGDPPAPALGPAP